MKLVYAIVRTDNEDDVIAELAKNRFGITKLSTTGGFLKKRKYDAADRYRG